MPDQKTETNSPRKARIPVKTAMIAAVLVIIAAVGGVFVGDLVSQKRVSTADSARADEFVGLGPRTGLTGELDLQVKPMTLSILPNKPTRVRLVFTNRSKAPLVLNNWLEALPSSFQTNQFPLKVIVTRNGRPVTHSGNAILRPPHTKRDFFVLESGSSREVEMDITRTAEGGTWDMSRPGAYKAEIWYENYLTGRYIGTRAWTGLSNHVVVQVHISNPGE